MSNLKYIGKNILNHDLILKKGDVSGSLASTGSFGKILGDGSDISNLPVSAINNATENRLVTIGATTSELDAESTLTFDGNQMDLSTTGHGTIHITGGTGKDANLKLQNNSRLWIWQNDGDNTLFGGGGALHLYDGTAGASRIIVDSTGVIETPMGVSGSSTSTGSFGRLDIADNVSATSFTGIFNGALSGSAQIASNISGAFAVASASFATDINALQTDSASFSTRVTKNEGTGSKILNGQLEFTNITASANISSSGNITGNILNVKTRVKAIGSSLEFAGDTLDFVDGSSVNRLFKGTAGGSVEAYHAGVKRLETTSGGINVIGNITGSGHISMSLSSTGSFGRVSATTLGGHSPLLIDSIVTASSAIQFDGKVFFETGSIEGDLHVRTNADLMRIGKSTSGIIVSGSEEVSRFATGSDGSIIDLGFTVIDENGNVVLAGDGDGIHIDSNNYWYNNKYVKFGDGRDYYFDYNNKTLKYSGEVIAKTGSLGGEMYISSPTGSMFIGKYTGGIPTSGSDPISRFATGSDGSIIDLGFTTTNEEGETVFLSTGDGVVVDSNNYWYTTGHFKVGNDDKSINWDTNNLTLTKVTASGDFNVVGDAYVQEYIYHKGDNDTFLRFAPNLVNLAAGGKSAIKYEASTGKIIVNNSNANVDFHVMADDGEEILATDAANNRVGINTTTPSTALHVVGDATITGRLTAQELHTEIESASVIFTSGSTIFGNSIDDTHRFTGSMFLTGSVSASVFLGDGSKLTGISSDSFSDGTATLISGSAVSTGSFGRVEVSGKVRGSRFEIDGTTDYIDTSLGSMFIVTAGDISAQLGTGKSLKVTGGIEATTNITGSGNLEIAGNISGSATSTGSFGTIQSSTATIPSLLGDVTAGGKIVIDQDQPIEFHQTLGIRDRIIRDSTSNAMNMLSRAHIGLIIDSNNDDTDAEFTIRANGYTHAASTPLLTVTQQGLISGSATSTGSFGRVESDKGDFITGSIGRIEATKGDFLKGLTIEPDANAHFIRATPASNGYSVLRWNADNGDSLWNFGLASGNNLYFYSYGNSSVPLELHRDTGRVGIGLAFGADPVSMLQVGGDVTVNGSVSGSATSTGSFGKLLGDGSEITGISTTPFPFTGSATISGSLTVSNVDGKVFEVTSELTGSLFSVSTISGIPALETFDDYRTVGRFERPMRTHTTNFTASALHGGYYNIVSASLTCSIVHPDTASVAIGTEFEFFVKDDGGRGLLFETQSMGTTQVLSKNGNMQLAGQYSGATLKKVDTDTWHLVGDLT